MNRIIPTIILAFCTTIMFAQISPAGGSTEQASSSIQLQKPIQQIQSLPSIGIRGGGTSPGVQSFGDTIFHETFSNGFAGDLGNGAWTVDGPNSWEYRGPTTNPDNTQGSRGAYAGTALIASPTVSNGFVIFDSDYLDNGGTANAFGSGPNPAIPGGHDGYLESPTFNLSNYSNVLIDMHSLFRRLRGTAHVVFSTDNGATWADTLTVFGDNHPMNAGAPNQPPLENPNRTTLPLPCGVAGNSQVKMRLYFSGNDCQNNLCAYYYWMVDDVYILEAPDHDLSMDEVWFGSPNLLIPTTSAKYYGQVPVRQASVDTVRVSGRISNKGTSAQTNTRMEVYVNGVLEETSNSVNMPAQCAVSDSLFVSNFLSLARTPGRYVIDFVSTSDNPNVHLEDDTITHIVDITDTAYSWVRRDNVTDNGMFFNSLSAYEIGMEIDVFQNDTVKGFDFFVSNFNNNASIILTLYEINNNGGISSVVQEFVQLNNNLNGNWANDPISDIPISPGKYLLGWESIGVTVYGATDSEFDYNPAMIINFQGQWQFLQEFRAPAIQLNTARPNCPQHTAQTTLNTPAGCGLSNGSATVVPNDLNVNVVWPDNTTGQTNSNLAAGTYNVSLQDSICVSVIQVTVPNQNAPQPVNGGLEITNEISANIVNAQEAGNLSLASDAEITANFTGGTPPYQYSWEHSGNTTQSSIESGLGAGSQYRVTAIDNNNCEGISQTITISDPPLMEVSIDTAKIPGNQTILTAQVQNGKSPFNYQWNDPGNSTSQVITVDDTLAYTYRVTVTDSVGAQAGATDVTGDSVVFVGCSAISYFIQKTPSNCNASDGEIRIVVGNGTPPYSFQWSSGGNSNVESNLSGGAFYSFTITDFIGCTIIDSTSLSDNGAPTITMNIDNPLDCFGDSDGQISLSVVGGSPPYQYNWSNK